MKKESSSDEEDSDEEDESEDEDATKTPQTTKQLDSKSGKKAVRNTISYVHE